MIDGIHVIDDVIPKSYQDEIERVMLEDAQWLLKYDVTYSKSIFDKLQEKMPDLKPRPGFNHSLVQSGEVISPIHLFLKPLILQGLDKIDKKLERVTLGRSFLQLPITDIHKDIKDPLHVDSYEPHMVFLYYVVTSDGHTLITDCLSDWQNDSAQNCVNYDYKKCAIIKRVKTKKGRLVMFDGRYYHAAEQSKKDIRCIINYNLQVSENE